MEPDVVTINPSTEEPLHPYQYLSGQECERLLTQSQSAFLTWRGQSVGERAQVVARLGQVLQQQKAQVAKMISLEMGKVYREALAEVEKCALTCQILSQEGSEWLQAEDLAMSPGAWRVCFQPLGVIFGIMPWNFPLWQVLRFAVPTILAGNTVVVKHAPNTFGCAELIQKLFIEAGFPQGAFQNLSISIDMAAKIIADPRIQGVSLTGSTRAGRAVAEICGKHLKKMVLELGGSDAYVILDDADLELAAQKCVASRMQNAGQSCVAAKRFIVTKKNHDAFVDLLREKLSQTQFGDPFSELTTFGPLARADLRQALHDQVQRSRKGGAECLLGGELPSGKGYFYPATLLVNVTADSVAFQEELFGPVAAVTQSQNESEAIELANQSVFGLGGAVFTRDRKRGLAIAIEQMQSGMCFVNELVRSDVRAPFGGIKQSGLGRELSAFGIHEFVNIKTIAVM